MLEKAGWKIEAVCCIYPSVPFIKVNDLLRRLNYLKKKVPYVYPAMISFLLRALKSDNKGMMHPFFSEYISVRTQDLESVYYDAGQFYWGWKESWYECHKIIVNGIGLKIPNWRVVDIDTNEDWIRAELIHKILNPL